MYLRSVKQPNIGFVLCPFYKRMRSDHVTRATIKVEYLEANASRHDDAGRQCLKTNLVDLLVCGIYPCLSILVKWHLQKGLEVISVKDHVRAGHHLLSLADVESGIELCSP